MEKKEKPLEKMTAKELREIALGLPGIQGVHAMKKEELLKVIREAKGLPETEVEKERRVVGKKEKKVISVSELKQKIRELKAKKDTLLEQRNYRMVKILRKRISRLKKKTRRLA